MAYRIAFNSSSSRNGFVRNSTAPAFMVLIGQAGNGREAIDSFREQRPDVTLMDLRMPDMNGIEALTTIRSEFPNARIIVLTTYAGDVTRNREQFLRSTFYLSKVPVAPAR